MQEIVLLIESKKYGKSLLIDWFQFNWMSRVPISLPSMFVQIAFCNSLSILPFLCSCFDVVTVGIGVVVGAIVVTTVECGIS